jgi:hypothetical protein
MSLHVSCKVCLERGSMFDFERFGLELGKHHQVALQVDWCLDRFGYEAAQFYKVLEQI